MLRNQDEVAIGVDEHEARGASGGLVGGGDKGARLNPTASLQQGPNPSYALLWAGVELVRELWRGPAPAPAVPEPDAQDAVLAA